MYQGFMKKGVSIMLLFFCWIALIAYFSIDEMLFCLPVIWFYGFFDGIHTNSMPAEEFALLKDDYLFADTGLERINFKKFRKPAAVLLIVFGAYNMLKVFLRGLNSIGVVHWNSPVIFTMEEMFPKMLFSFIIILLGLYLISGKREELEKKELEEEKQAENTFYMENARFWEDETEQKGEVAEIELQAEEEAEKEQKAEETGEEQTDEGEKA